MKRILKLSPLCYYLAALIFIITVSSRQPHKIPIRTVLLSSESCSEHLAKGRDAFSSPRLEGTEKMFIEAMSNANCLAFGRLGNTCSRFQHRLVKN